jgi:hypothetical protein
MKALFFFLAALVTATPLGAGEVDSRTTTIEEIRTQVSRSSSIDSLVGWLKGHKNVSDVNAQPILLTTAPPQQSISFLIEGKRYRFRLMKELDMEVVSVGGSGKTVVQGKVVIMGEEGPTAKK